MKNLLKEIKARTVSYTDNKARADVTTLLNLLEDLTIKHKDKSRLFIAPGIELRYKNHEWQSVINLGDWIGTGRENFSGEICSHYTDIESAINIALDICSEQKIILPREERKPLLFHDKSVPDELQDIFLAISQKMNFRTQ
ncbi:MAG: hypothetical protein GWP19_11605 [Planctomycetia bacterium]|nr:hypothetical protein [Planctomycetia bacterium]